MSDNSSIEWTDTTPRHIKATAAARVGITLTEYEQRITAGEKWCGGCRQWHARTAFAVDRSRGDGLVKWCRAFTNNRSRTVYQPRPRPAAGRRFADARDGDDLQARRRVNHLVDVGVLPHPNTVSCTDCGHVWTAGERRHEYDHHLGYAAEHHEHVEAVCTTCHHTREESRRAA